MNTTAVESRLRDFLGAQLAMNPSEVTHNAALVQDLGANSLDVLEFAMDAELAFDIELDEEDLPELVTFGQFVAHVEAAVQRHAFAVYRAGPTA